MLHSKLFNIWRGLAARFLIEDSPPVGGGALLETTITPVTNIDDLVADYLMGSAAVVGSTGNVTVLTVPQGERWEIMHMDYTRTSGDRVADGWSILSAGSAIRVDLPGFTDTNSFRSPLEMMPLILQNSQLLQMSHGAAGADDGTYLATYQYRRTIITPGD